MAHSKPTKLEAKRLYLEGNNINDISAGMGIPRSTIEKWKRNEDWDSEFTQYSAHQLAEDMQKEFYLGVKKAIKEGKLTDPGTADALLKSSQLMAKVIPEKVLLSNLMKMLKDQTEYFQRFADDDFVLEWGKHLQGLSEFLRKRYGTE